MDDLLQFHSRDYLDVLMAPGKRADDTLEEYGLDHDCAPFPTLPSYVRLVTGATLTACRALTSDRADIAISWDGGRHHAHRSQASGFCHANDVVLAITHLHAHGRRRVLYLDLDIHHGDGVEDAFERSRMCLRVSTHLWEKGFFPGSGGDVVAVGGDGESRRRGSTHAINLPLRRGLRTESLIALLEAVLPPAVERYAPDAVVVQCGADGLATDTLCGAGAAGWNLDTRATGEALRCVWEAVMGSGRMVPTLVLGGGGYNAVDTARAWCQATRVLCEGLFADGVNNAMLVGPESGVKTTVDVNVCVDIPEHDLFPLYGPDFSLYVGAKNCTDENTEEFVAGVVERSLAKIQLLA
ncbi:Histone deacetylase 8 [Irineochytrium annulatum]|nr:Histone deacetylase 8 [Irineochytrium annulatum]